MIFTREQWYEIYVKYRGEKGEKAIRPPELIMGILEQDALEHGIHQDWIDFWNNPHLLDANRKWANTLYVILNYRPGEFIKYRWGQPRT